MTSFDAVGYLASSLVLAAFSMKNVVPLRIVAIFSNVGFIVYGFGLELTPVWVLHAALLPMNGWRLWQAQIASATRDKEHRLRAPSDNGQMNSLSLARAA
jgi:hypothetical protein